MKTKLHILFFFFLLFQSSILFGKATVIHAPGIITGSVEVVAQKVTDLTSLATLVYDVAVDKEARSQIYNQFVEIKNETGEDPKAFLPILIDVTVTVTTNKTPEQIQEIFDEKTDAGQRAHYAVSSTGNAILSVMAGTAMIKDLSEIAEKLGENIKKVKRIIPKSIDGIKHLIKVDKNKSFFWFGNTNGIGGEARALEIAESQGGITLEGLLKNKNIDMPVWDASNPTVIKL
jgi:hypothetical protein